VLAGRQRALARRALLWTAGVAALGAAAAGSVVPRVAKAQAPGGTRELRLIVFPGGFNLPVWVAQEKGFFARQNLSVTLTLTPGSVFQLTRLIAGDFDVALTAVDNVIAYDEGQGEVSVPGRPDLFAFMGSDNGFLRLIVQSGIQSYADLRGKRLSVDAVTTGYAFVLRKMLEVNGLGEGEYTLVPAGGALRRWEALLKGEHAGTLLLSPFEILARERGFRLLANAVDVLPRYQGLVGAARRSWAAAHRTELIGYIRAHREALSWLYSPANRDEGIQLLARNANLPPQLAAEAHAILVDPEHGFAPAASPDFEGIRTVLALRTRYARPRKTLTNPLGYVDLSYYLS